MRKFYPISLISIPRHRSARNTHHRQSYFCRLRCVEQISRKRCNPSILSKMKLAACSLALLLTASSRLTSGFVVGAAARSSSHRLFLFDKLFSTSTDSKYPVMAEESVMSQKAHGTSEKPVQKNLRWNCDFDTADRST